MLAIGDFDKDLDEEYELMVAWYNTASENNDILFFLQKSN
jgi:hypothetical protein